MIEICLYKPAASMCLSLVVEPDQNTVFLEIAAFVLGVPTGQFTSRVQTRCDRAD